MTSRRGSQFIWLVMANDHPDRGFTSEASADQFCRKANEAQRSPDGQPFFARIYYRWTKVVVVRGEEER